MFFRHKKTTARVVFLFKALILKRVYWWSLACAARRDQIAFSGYLLLHHKQKHPTQMGEVYLFGGA